MPSQTIGKFEINVDKNVVFDSKDYGGFMDIKQEIRDNIAPELSL
jgi:predicted Rdx family selenoprotein